jgi:hypothetical protein
MNGRIVGGAIVLSAVVAGAALYYLQVYHWYEDVSDRVEGVVLTALDGTPEEIRVENLRAIDAASSPIRFRACFDTPEGLGTLTQTYVVHPDAEPLTAPGWFDCFDAAALGAALERGEAVAFLGQENIVYGIDRVVAIGADGRGYAWNQINRCGAEVFDGRPPPEGCPPPPAREGN